MGKWANWIIFTTQSVEVQIGRNAISFDINMHSPIYLTYTYQMEYEVRSECQATKALRVRYRPQPHQSDKGNGPLQSPKIRDALTNCIHPTYLTFSTSSNISLYQLVHIYINIHTRFLVIRIRLVENVPPTIRKVFPLLPWH